MHHVPEVVVSDTLRAALVGVGSVSSTLSAEECRALASQLNEAADVLDARHLSDGIDVTPADDAANDEGVRS